jgi:hypothetical protein
MTTDLTEDEMRRALFGFPEAPAPIPELPPREQASAVAVVPPVDLKKPKPAKSFTPRMRVTLRVGNVFEGETQMLTHDADTLSSLQAELDATKAARKKFKYAEVVSVKPAG